MQVQCIILISIKATLRIHTHILTYLHFTSQGIKFSCKYVSADPKHTHTYSCSIIFLGVYSLYYTHQFAYASIFATQLTAAGRIEYCFTCSKENSREKMLTCSKPMYVFFALFFPSHFFFFRFPLLDHQLKCMIFCSNLQNGMRYHKVFCESNRYTSSKFTVIQIYIVTWYEVYSVTGDTVAEWMLLHRQFIPSHTRKFISIHIFFLLHAIQSRKID